MLDRVLTRRMRPSLAAWLLGLVALVGRGLGHVCDLPGLHRPELGSIASASGAGDAAFPIDPRNSAHQKHLVSDAHIAEELAIRHADVEFGRRFGVEHHGGLIDSGRFRRECLSRMRHAIENNHGVTSEQVQLAGGQRNWTFDVAVSLLFLPLYLLGAIVASRWLLRRFSSDEQASHGWSLPAWLPSRSVFSDCSAFGCGGPCGRWFGLETAT